VDGGFAAWQDRLWTDPCDAPTANGHGAVFNNAKAGFARAQGSDASVGQ
jgi:hypothetical protein